MNDEFWLRFVQTGRVEDYLEYKKHEKYVESAGTPSNENHNEWLGYKGTDNRGE